LPWTDELAVVLYVWIILWAGALMVPEREQVMFDLVWNAAPRALRRWMRLVGNAMIGGLSAWALPACWDYVHFMKREGTPVLGIPFMWVFLPFVILLLALVVRSVLGMWRAWQGLDLEDAGVPS
jgi:TRAP-type C4-dicarboxylate transport system permease small subunit